MANHREELKVAGLYRRGQVFWYQPPMIDGFRPKPFSLESTDRDDAIGKVLEWRRKPELVRIGEWEAEVERYLRERLEDERMSHHTVSNRRIVLGQFRKFAEVATPRDVLPDHVQRWYDHYKTKNAQTAWDYVSHICFWMIFPQMD